MSQATLNDTIRRYYREQCVPPNARGRSWDHCHRFFRKHVDRGDLLCVEDHAALHLGFYLASWGMHRGRFLREHAYTVHKPVIHVLASSRFSDLWQPDLGTRREDIELAGMIMDLVKTVEATYRELMVKKQQEEMGLVVTKVLLGTVGCLPARDTYFEKGFKHEGNTYGSLNRSFVQRVLDFCAENRSTLKELQREIVEAGGPQYPLMKLVDMYFWQIGKST